MHNNTRLFSLAAFGLLGALLAGCSSTPAPSATPAPEAPVQSAPTQAQADLPAGSWRDDFLTLDTARWSVSANSWTPFWAKDGVSGRWESSNVSVKDGYLVMRLDVAADLAARGAEIATNATIGYGSYEARMRAASSSADPLVAGASSSGNISAFFNYVNNSETEIDHEIEGQSPSTDWVGTWQTTQRHDYGTGSVGANLSQAFHTYRWDWSPSKVDFYIDGVLKKTVTSVVPTAQARLMLNLWPTNSTGWGGRATPGTTYMLVDYVSFTPAGTTVVAPTPAPAPAPSDDVTAGALALSAAAPVSGSVSSSDLQDWYKLTATDQGGAATINLATSVNSDLEVYAADGVTLLGSSRRGKGSADSVALTLKPGLTYYARVTWASRTPAYTLSATGAVR
ncbi:family 16 glycosylhydrolase [Deinococcus navajonensis]|uniref:Family 16 glycosylhydrolase n=1 Tax=Deinococcus navajonensis TaxID=309884 RepID=A0ABV8XN11_9DEIO